jgi:hypothetical protein
MRVAVLFYGRITHFDKRHLLKKLDRSHEIDVFYSCSDQPDDLIDDFINLYEPIAMNRDKIEYSIDLSAYTKGTGTNIHNMICHFINLKRVFQLLEEHVLKTGATYDLVIMTRLDLMIESLELVQPKVNTIYIPSGNDHAGINDLFAMGSIDSMRHYANILDNMTVLLDTHVLNVNPEKLTLGNMIYCGITIERFPMDYLIHRSAYYYEKFVL